MENSFQTAGHRSEKILHMEKYQHLKGIEVKKFCIWKSYWSLSEQQCAAWSPFNVILFSIDKCYILLYTVCYKGVTNMNIIINNSSMQPIYEQIINQIKVLIMSGSLKDGAMLPSVRSLAKDIQVSALTIKKSYDALEQQGFIITVHGKGSFVSCANQEPILEEKRKNLEKDLEQAIRKGRSLGMNNKELIELFMLILEE